MFVWLNTTHMHMFTHTQKREPGTGGSLAIPYHDTMIDHDKNVGQMLDFLDDSASPKTPLSMYSTDNGPHRNSWPDGGMTPFRSEKTPTGRAPSASRCWCAGPGRSRPARYANGIVQHHDWLPTSWPSPARRVIDKLKKGYKAIGATYKNHIDGFNLLPTYWRGKGKPAEFFFYFSDDGDMLGIRYDNWKLVFMEQRTHGTMAVWAEPFIRLRLPKLFNLRTDPYEYADKTSNTFYNWFLYNAYFIYAAQAGAAMFAETFKEFPAVQRPNTFTVDDALAKMDETMAGSG